MKYAGTVGRRACVVALWIAACFPLPGCGGGNETQVASSGNPEADRRAEMRVGASEEDGKPGAARATLFERLGGRAGIQELVDDMTARSIADPRVNFERNNVKTSWLGGKYTPWAGTPENIERFKRQMVDFLVLASGGPAEYSGRDMRTVHKGMGITNNEFDAMIGDIKTSMDRLKYASREKRELLAIFETTRKQVVEKQ